MTDQLMYRPEFFVGGDWTPPTGDDMFDVVSPSTEEVVGRVPVALNADVDSAVAAARNAFDEGPWPTLPAAERADVLARAAELLRQRHGELGEVLVDEMGATTTSAPFTALMAADTFDYYAELAREFPFERRIKNAHGAGLVVDEPVGVVGAIIPWNFPVILASWKLAPALAAGCAVILKPPLESPLGTFVFGEVLQEAGLPAGVLSIVPGGREVGEHIVTHPRVDKIAFTGSTAAGKRIMSLCGQQVKRVSLELGGKSASVVLEDADLGSVIPALVSAAMVNAGQVCAMQSRLLVPRSRYNEATDLAASAAAAVRVGDPHDANVDMGPLVSQRQRDRVENYFAIAREEGVSIACGGGRPANIPKGWFVEPTILTSVDNSMRVAREEIFGPVVSIIPHDGDEDAIRIANDSPYGLSGGVYSGDDERGLQAARRIRTGTVFVNGSAAPPPLAPFGGFKESGIGRELGPEGLANFLEVKSIGLPPSLAED